MRLVLCFLGIFAALSSASTGQSLQDFHRLVQPGSWTEHWPDAAGQSQPRTVTAELWTRAMQAVLDARGVLHIPAREQPYYLDGPLVLKSGQKLTADPRAELRLKPGTSTCMVRNEHVIGFAEQPVPESTRPDTDILIEGGIWTTLATSPKETNGNMRGRSAIRDPVHGTHGVFLLHNVRRVTVRNITVRQSKAFAVHLANAQEFTVEGVTLDRHGRDGVHVNGPASHGIIRHVQGDSADDTVALNAWEWKNYAPSHGAIHHITIEHVTGTAQDVHAANSIRLLPGVKRFKDGATLDCPVHDITLRNVTDIREFKLYAQPNLELGRDNDFSLGVGTLRGIRFENLLLHFPAKIEIHAATDRLSIQNVRLFYPRRPGEPLVAIGPKSATYKHGPDPARWTEIFSPDLDCTVRNLTIENVTAQDGAAIFLDEVVQVIEQKPNADYPRTTPRGGTGRGRWVR